MADLSRHRSQQASATFGSGTSIYDYPEHLNPFYEDENHKRLRFLEHKPRKTQRKGSLSSLRDGLRELWQFSSIRFGKKRSSTLGINKTSESPPPLRRGAYELDSNDTFAGGTSGTYSANQSYTATPILFVRHERYRSSLQERQKDNDGIEFDRHNRMYSTMQNRYTTYDRMTTSTPRKKHAAPQPYGTTPRVMQHQQQLNNTNPFDTEMEPDGDTISMISVDSSYSCTLRSSRSGMRTRTKRRAPPPPSVSVSSANWAALTTSVEEPPPPPVGDDVQREDLHNLTAEIESFVRISTTDGSVAPDGQTVPSETRVAFDVNNNNAQPEIPTTISTIESELVREEQIGEDAKRESLAEVKQTNVERLTAVPVTESSNDSVPLEASEPVVEQHTTTTVTIDTAVTASTAESNPKPSPRKKQDNRQSEVTGRQADIDFENLALPETPVPVRRSIRENREMYITQDVATTVAKNEKPVVVASAKPQLAPTTEEADDEEGPTTTIIVDNLQYKLKVVPIQTEINTKIESARMKISESTGNISTAANDATERRRSVRDIIESINKSQSMLKVNHEQPSNGLHETQSTDSMTQKIRELNECEQEIQNLLQGIGTLYGNNGGAATDADTAVPVPIPTGRGSYYDNVADDNLNDNLDDKSNMYAASGGFRVKKSPTKTVIIGETDDTQFQDCINWNPVPKPRRTHNLVDSAPDTEQQPSIGMVAQTSPSS